MSIVSHSFRNRLDLFILAEKVQQDEEQKIQRREQTRQISIGRGGRVESEITERKETHHEHTEQYFE